jgi:hypothetical protein
MSEKLTVQYLGYQAKALFREYRFLVLTEWRNAREYTVTIANEAFRSQGLRFQDGPDICSLKLRRELGVSNGPVPMHYRITDVELGEYRDAHPTDQARRNLYKRKSKRPE